MSGKTGETCQKSGTYVCQKHGNTIRIKNGHTFPPCQRDNDHAATWIWVSA